MTRGIDLDAADGAAARPSGYRDGRRLKGLSRVEVRVEIIDRVTSTPILPAAYFRSLATGSIRVSILRRASPQAMRR